MQREVKARSTNLAKGVKMNSLVLQGVSANTSSVSIDQMREACGTAPSSKPKYQTAFLTFPNGLEVDIVDHNKNPYKAMFAAATATWGDNQYKSKWEKTQTHERLEVIKAVLTNNTLPLAREVVHFLFRVKGTPRWLFDYHTHTPFTAFMSIGCRDNNKSDADIVLTSSEDSYKSRFQEEALEEAKKLYHTVVSEGKGSWQAARTFLPQSYQHSYHFSQNLLSIASMKFDESVESEWLKVFYEFVTDAIYKKFPLIGLYIRYSIIKDEDFSTIKKYKSPLGADEKYFFERE